MIMQKSFDSAEEFLSALSAGNLQEPIIITGAAAQAEEDSHAILFSEGTSATLWTRISADLIEKIEVIGQIVAPDNRKLPYIRLHLHTPTDEQAALFAQLLKNSSRGAELPCDSLGFAMTSGSERHAHQPCLTAGLGLSGQLMRTNTVQGDRCRAACAVGLSWCSSNCMFDPQCIIACQLGYATCRARCPE
jgi:hypothetical protein